MKYKRIWKVFDRYQNCCVKSYIKKRGVITANQIRLTVY